MGSKFEFKIRVEFEPVQIHSWARLHSLRLTSAGSFCSGQASAHEGRSPRSF
jgi:hypothetical protein